MILIQDRRGAHPTDSEGARPHTHTFWSGATSATSTNTAVFSDPDERRASCFLAPSLLRKGLK